MSGKLLGRVFDSAPSLIFFCEIGQNLANKVATPTNSSLALPIANEKSIFITPITKAEVEHNKNERKKHNKSIKKKITMDSKLNKILKKY
jgi:hypothetical protein